MFMEHHSVSGTTLGAGEAADNKHKTSQNQIKTKPSKNLPLWSLQYDMM